MLSQAIDRCRACGSGRIPEVLSLGDFALSDFLDSPDAHTDRAPLVLVRCEVCTLVQLRDTVERDRLYREYWYRSATQPAMVKALQDVVRDAQNRVPLRPGDVVVDIGANDGTLLSLYPDSLDRIGVEPSRTFDIPASASMWVSDYWPTQACMLPTAKIITSCACFYDAPDPLAFVAGIAANLADDGIWINQVAYLPDTLAANNFGDICHEHLTYWTVKAFDHLLEGTGLYLNDYTFNDVNGGSVRFIVSRKPVKTLRHDAPSVLDFARFHGRIDRITEDLAIKVMMLARGGKLVIGYGASTKGNTYLQRWLLQPDELPYIADRNPDKWGKYTPTGQKVISEEEMRAMKPDYLLVLPYHFLDAFLERERPLLEAGTKMLVPFPTLRVIGGADAGLLPSRSSSGVLAAPR